MKESGEVMKMKKSRVDSLHGLCITVYIDSISKRKKITRRKRKPRVVLHDKSNKKECFSIDY